MVGGRFGLILLLGLLLTGCLGPGPRSGPLSLGDQTFTTDQNWSGELLIDGIVKVIGGATLTIEPGTTIRFVRRDADEDGLGDARLELEHASLVAIGRSDAPIRFLSAESTPAAGDWLELKVDFARRLELRWCEIRHSAHGLHAHFSKGLVEDSVLRDNIDGTRFGQGRFRVAHSLIADNRGKGLNFRNSQVELVHNILRNNRTGIFIFETDRELTIEQNNFIGNRTNLRLGDFFTGDIEVGRNWFGSSAPRQVAAKLHDRGEDPTIGVINAEVASAWLVESGPRQPLRLEPLWQIEAEGYFDAGPVAADGIVYLPNWDGHLYAVRPDGSLLWKSALGEVSDVPVTLSAERLYLQSWGREVLALNRHDGRILWRFSFPESPNDDHRQGGLLLTPEALLVPAWNGRLYALDPGNGKLLWQTDCAAPLRAAPLLHGDRIYQVSGSGRLTALSPQGEMLWQKDLGSPLLSTPAAVEGGIVLLSKAGLLIRLDDAGGELWRRQFAGPCFYGGPVVADDLVLVPSGAGRLSAVLARSGEPLWQYRTGPLYSTPRVAAGRVFFGDNHGVLRVLSLESGDLIATTEVGGAIQGRPLVVDDRLLVGARDGRFHAWQLLTGEDN